MTLLDILAQPIARYIIVPILSCLIGTLISYSSMNDNCRRFSWQLCKWDTGIITTNFLLIVTDIGSYAQYDKVTNQFLSDVIIAFALTLLITVVISLIKRSNARRFNYEYGVFPKSIILVSNIFAVSSLALSYIIIY